MTARLRVVRGRPTDDELAAVVAVLRAAAVSRAAAVPRRPRTVPHAGDPRWARAAGRYVAPDSWAAPPIP